MRPYLLAIAVLITLTRVEAPSAATFDFYEGNNCTQDRLMSVSSNRWRTGRVFVQPMELDGRGNNDEIRSVLVTSDWRRQVEPRSFAVTVFDDPRRRKHDDFAWVVVHDATLIPPQGICVGSFEHPFDRDGVHLIRFPVNGLDGKISSMHLVCDAFCARDLTPDPAAATSSHQQGLSAAERLSRRDAVLEHVFRENDLPIASAVDLPAGLRKKMIERPMQMQIDGAVTGGRLLTPNRP